MGNHRFRLSDMIPNAWFYKLKDMSKTKNPNTNTNTNTNTNPNKKPTSSKSKSKSKSNPPQKPHLSQTTRYSYYITTQPTKENYFFNSPVNPKASDTHFPENPRRLSTKRPKRRAVYKPSPKKLIASNSSVSSPLNCNCHAAIHTMVESPDYFGSSSESSSEPDFHELIPSEFECDQFGGGHMAYNCRVSSSTSDTIIDMKDESFAPKVDDHDPKVDGFDMISEMELPPILTKPMRLDHDHHKANEATFRRSSSKMKEIRGKSSLTVKIVKEESIRKQNKGHQTKPYSKPFRKSSANSTSSGIRLRGNSPRFSRKSVSSSTLSSSSSAARLKSKNRRISESFAVVKSSVDPQRDFRESMMEMVVENNIRASKDLEDLLACYLSLNSNEYHHLIIKAFEQIWFDIAHLKM